VIDPEKGQQKFIPIERSSSIDIGDPFDTDGVIPWLGSS